MYSPIFFKTGFIEIGCVDEKIKELQLQHLVLRKILLGDFQDW